MNEFDIYMQLGNRLEVEGKIVMAHAAYLEAMSKGGIAERKVIESYLPTLGKKLSKGTKEWNEEVKGQLLQWIREGEIRAAVVCIYNVVEQLNGKQWIDTDNAILYQCLMIYQAEYNAGMIPWKIEGKSMEELNAWYYKLKFMVRRVDMSQCEDDKFIEYIKKDNISKIALYEMIKTMCFFPQKVYTYLAKLLKKYQMDEYALFFEELCDGNEIEDVWEVPSVKEEFQGKVAFIIAVNEEQIYNEAVYYINHLKVPENIEIEIVPIRNAVSLASAYNQGMTTTNAKYKVYMHQDVMLVNPYILYEICHIFQDEEIGMIGVAGAGEIPPSGMWWEAKDKEIFCRIYQDMIMEHNLSGGNVIAKEYQRVKVIDGVLMITQYDIPWREELFQNWHFYDISQSMEFYKQDKKIVIPKQQNVWCLHEQKWNKKLGTQYYESKEVFLKEYKDLL